MRPFESCKFVVFIFIELQPRQRTVQSFRHSKISELLSDNVLPVRNLLFTNYFLQLKHFAKESYKTLAT
jgi:hypothetical protein